MSKLIVLLVVALSMLSGLALESAENFRQGSQFCNSFDSEPTICQYCCNHFGLSVGVINSLGKGCSCGHPVNFRRTQSEEDFRDIIERLAESSAGEREAALKKFQMEHLV